MATIELTAGSFEYQDTGGSGPVVVLLHGLAMNDSLCATSSLSLAPTTAA